MFLGGDKFLHAPHTGDVVKVSSLERALLRAAVRGRAPLRRGRRRRRRPGRRARAAAAAVAAAAAAAPAIDPTEVAKAQAAVARDAAEVRRNDSQLFQAIKAVEATKEREKQRLDDVPEGGRPVAGQAPGGRRGRAPGRAAAPRRSRPAAVAPAPHPAARGRAAAPGRRAPAGRGAVAAASIDLTNAATDYPGDNASQAELAKWLAKQAEQAGLPPELPVMASLVESGVKNLNFGDARLRRLLPDARRDLEPGRLRRLPREARAAGQVVHRPGARRQAQARSPTATPTSARTRPSSASGSPTSSAPPSSSAAATSCGSARRASC